MLTDKKQINK